MLEEGIRKPSRTRVGFCKRGSAVCGVDRGNVTAVKPQPVLEYRPADLVSRLDNLAVVLLRYVVLWRTVEACTGAKARQRRIEAQTAVLCKASSTALVKPLAQGSFASNAEV
jgi:hypothetical protein